MLPNLERQTPSFGCLLHLRQLFLQWYGSQTEAREHQKANDASRVAPNTFCTKKELKRRVRQRREGGGRWEGWMWEAVQRLLGARLPLHTANSGKPAQAQTRPSPTVRKGPPSWQKGLATIWTPQSFDPEGWSCKKSLFLLGIAFAFPRAQTWSEKRPKDRKSFNICFTIRLWNFAFFWHFFSFNNKKKLGKGGSREGAIQSNGPQGNWEAQKPLFREPICFLWQFHCGGGSIVQSFFMIAYWCI